MTVEDESDFRWIYVVNDTSELDVNTDKLIEFIIKYGINARDDIGYYISGIFNFMNENQLDLVFDKYKYDIYIEYSLCFDRIINKNILYVFRKCLEADYEYRYLTDVFETYDESERTTLKDFLDRYWVKYNKCISKKNYTQMCELFDNHCKKGESFFQIMLSKLKILIK